VVQVRNTHRLPFENILASGRPMHQRMQLAPGGYRLRWGVIDINNHRMGTLDMPIEVSGVY
jgi:hypothetical protein